MTDCQDPWPDSARDVIITTVRGKRRASTGVVRGGKEFRVAIDKHADFWRLFDNGSWEPRTTEALLSLLDDSTTFLDIGAWIGPTALVGAQKARRVIAFEPDPAAFEELLANLELNADKSWARRVTALPMAVSTHTGPIAIGSRTRRGDSMSSSLFADGENSWIAAAVSATDVATQFTEPDERVLLKIDIEGGEFAVVPVLIPILSRRNLSVVLSLHTSNLKGHLFATGYRGRLRRHMIATISLARLLHGLRGLDTYSLERSPISRGSMFLRFLAGRQIPAEVLAVTPSMMAVKNWLAQPTPPAT